MIQTPEFDSAVAAKLDRERSRARLMPFILTIRERNNSWSGRSPVTSTHPTSDAAKAELRDYVRRNWDSEMGTDPPQELDEMVAEYFAEVLEVYDISETAPLAARPERQ